jgi:diketogulonate reductase-like aldo/keto reductase
MVTRAIPRTGEPLPVVGLGTWQTFDVTAVEYGARGHVLRRFIELGGKLIDSSPMYGKSERVVGDLAAEQQVRDKLFVATKVWTRGRSTGVMQMEESFRKLRVDRIDLMQVHNLVDVESHLETLAEWKAQGRVRYVGVTHYTVESHAALEPFLRRGDIDFVQFNYSIEVRDAERRLLPMAAEHGVATLINRPFENGDVFRVSRHKPLPPVAEALNCRTWAQLCVKYIVSHPAVTCIIPATSNIAHLEENMLAAQEPLPDHSMRAAVARAWDS